MDSLGPHWIDAHSHLADLRFHDLKGALKKAHDLGITHYLQGGVGPEDWERQKLLAQTEPGILPVFGLHPYWVSEHTMAECDQGLDLLGRSLKPAFAIGEMGLDFRPHILKETKEQQIHCFEAQLEMAHFTGKACVLHLVQAFGESLQILDLFGAGTRGFVHAFTGSVTQAQAYNERGFLISVGGAVLKPNLTRLHQAIVATELDFILLETDSPDQAPPGIEPGDHSPASLIPIAQKVAELKNSTASQVLDKSRENLRKLLNQGAHETWKN